MFYDAWIKFFSETFLFLAVCVGLNLRYNFVWSSYGDGLNSLLAIIFGLMLVAFLFFVPIFYSKEKNYMRIKLNDVDFVARFGTIFSEFHFWRRHESVLIYKTF